MASTLPNANGLLARCSFRCVNFDHVYRASATYIMYLHSKHAHAHWPIGCIQRLHFGFFCAFLGSRLFLSAFDEFSSFLICFLFSRQFAHSQHFFFLSLFLHLLANVLAQNRYFRIKLLKIVNFVGDKFRTQFVCTQNSAFAQVRTVSKRPK